MSSEVALFTGYESAAPSAQAERLFQAWRATPGCRPMLANTRRETIVKKRIAEAINGGFDHDTILAALEECWKFESVKAWDTALTIGWQEIQKRLSPSLSDTQLAVMRVRRDAIEG